MPKDYPFGEAEPGLRVTRIFLRLEFSDDGGILDSSRTDDLVLVSDRALALRLVDELDGETGPIGEAVKTWRRAHPGLICQFAEEAGFVPVGAKKHVATSVEAATKRIVEQLHVPPVDDEGTWG